MESKSLFKPPFTNVIKAGRVKLSPEEDVGEHITEKREELIIVLKGVATLYIDSNSVELNEGETYYIEEGKKHNVVNNTTNALEYIYVVNPLN